jgi:hypothetical protein
MTEELTKVAAAWVGARMVAFALARGEAAAVSSRHSPVQGSSGQQASLCVHLPYRCMNLVNVTRSERCVHRPLLHG